MFWFELGGGSLGLIFLNVVIIVKVGIQIGQCYDLFKVFEVMDFCFCGDDGVGLVVLLFCISLCDGVW